MMCKSKISKIDGDKKVKELEDRKMMNFIINQDGGLEDPARAILFSRFSSPLNFFSIT